MRNLLFVILSLCCSFGSVSAHDIDKSSQDESFRREANVLLAEWMDTFLNYQCSGLGSSLDGGVLCPACARIHGRIGDAVLPLMYLADKTHDEKYLNGAKRLMAWMENVHCPDGAWMNDVNVSNWNGTTVFAAIALYEALHYHGHLLDDSTYNHWKAQLVEAGEFIMNNPFIYSRKRDGMRNMNVNYSGSATYALYAIGELCNRPDFKAKAKEIAVDLRPYFTKNDYFVYGEGPNIYHPTKNGCLPVDLLYNVEETLPNMAHYAVMAQDTVLLSLIERSMSTHLEFMLPDGAWDNSWGTRSFKWTYWGGRTSDGFMGGYYLLSSRHPEYWEAIKRNVALLRKATHNGLLYGGMHYLESGVAPCIHHTFGHAKALTACLEQQPKTDLPSQPLPRDKAYGVKCLKDINTWLTAYGNWRATFTGYDSEYKVKGTHPMGGAISMLWHAEGGPLFAATMNKYQLIEAPNMQVTRRKYLTCGTPRLELMQGGNAFTNLDDLNTDITCITEKGKSVFRTHTHLVDINQKSPSEGKEISADIKYVFSEHGVHIEVEQCPEGAYLVLPAIASPADKVTVNAKKAYIEKEKGEWQIHCQTGTISQGEVDADGRVFNPVPGFAFVPLHVSPEGNKITVDIDFGK